MLDAFKRLEPHLNRNRWVGSRNRYRKNCVDFLKNDLGPGGTVVENDLAQYLAASVPLHCADGWSFLSRAVQCHVTGDADASRHMGYYAELRAAMSILAAEGKGIFNNRHIIFDQNQVCNHVPSRLRRGTHDMTWLALDDWAGSPSSSELLGDVIQPNGKPLKEWLQAFSSGNQYWSFGREWFTEWGLDLQTMFKDRDARNEASYRPTRINSVAPLSFRETRDSVFNLWRFCEPVLSPFEKLDRHLLRLGLEKAFWSTEKKLPRRYPAVFRERMNQVVKNMSLNNFEKQWWNRFLTRRLSPDDPAIIRDAKQNRPMTDPHHHLHVIARATLLLRIASGVTAKFLSESRYNSAHFEFWWKRFGLDRGLWLPSDLQSDFRNLWPDVEEAINELQRWQPKQGQKRTYAYLRKENPGPISVLCSCERIALWGLGLWDSH